LFPSRERAGKKENLNFQTRSKADPRFFYFEFGVNLPFHTTNRQLLISGVNE
jgi:hypothetical protein